MGHVAQLGDALEIAEKLSIEEQETLIDILSHRLTALKREQVIREVCAASEEYERGECDRTTPEDIARELMS